MIDVNFRQMSECEKENSYRHHMMRAALSMAVLMAVLLLLPPVRRLWDRGVIRFDMMTCYCCLLTLTVLVGGGRRYEKKLWGQLPPPPTPKSILPFILSLVILCIVEKPLATFITGSVLHAADSVYDVRFDEVSRYINAVYFVLMTVWITFAEADSRRRQRILNRKQQLEQTDGTNTAEAADPEAADVSADDAVESGDAVETADNDPSC